MKGPVGTPARSTAARIETLTRHQEFGDARNRLSDAARLVRCQLGNAKTVTLAVVAAINPCERHAVGVPHFIAVGILPDQRPGRLGGLTLQEQNKNIGANRSIGNSVMPSSSQADAQDADGLEAAVDQAIAACGGDLRSTIRALIVANDYLESE
jgi:hypothetical protein